jgi:dTDP-4-amino-4,6-dideoxygalactose transaminase
MITKSATDKLNCTLNLHFTCNARTAWGHIIKTISNVRKPKVLLPSYIGYTEREGSGVFDPVKENSAKYDFYKVTNNLAIDIDHFEQILKSGEISIALIIHYFGFCANDMDRIKQLCIRHNVILVEDCAHAFRLGLKNQKIGSYGDFSFYSLHKYLATISGGALKVNTDKFNIDPLVASKKASADVLEQYATTDLEKVANLRKQNFRSYEGLLCKSDEIEVMYKLGDDDIPNSFPILIKNGKREKLYFYLMNKGIPTVALYYRLISEISKEKYPQAFEISDEILNLPVHQDIIYDDIKNICNCILDFFKG